MFFSVFSVLVSYVIRIAVSTPVCISDTSHNIENLKDVTSGYIFSHTDEVIKKAEANVSSQVIYYYTKLRLVLCCKEPTADGRKCSCVLSAATNQRVKAASRTPPEMFLNFSHDVSGYRNNLKL